MAAFVYKKRSALVVRLRLLEFAIDNDSYQSALDALSIGILMAVELADKAPDGWDPDSEIDIIENMLGLSFVVCQIQINAVLQRVFDPNLKPRVARDLGPRFNETYSKIEILWALANYFKHNDEWTPKTWQEPEKQSKFTVAVINAAGLKSGSNGNLRAGARALGNVSFVDVARFGRIVQLWSERVRDLSQQYVREHEAR